MLCKEYNAQLCALRVVMFCWFGASACLLPYMTIHMRQLGITVEETTIVYTVLPFVQMIGSPIAGFIADKLGNYKPILAISLIVSILTSFALMLVPSSGDPEQQQTPQSESRHQYIFWGYFVVRIIFQIAVGICTTLLDATSIALCEKHETSFGRVRFWAILSTGIFSPICGLLVDRLSQGLDEFSTDYSPTFHFFNFLVFFTLITLAILDIEVTSPPKNLLQNFKPLLKSLVIWVLLIIVFILGTLWGFVESFLFWYLLDLEAPKFLLGLTLTTGAIISLPFLHSSDWLIKKLGHANLMIIALLFYFIRFVGYSFIHSPFWCFPFEAMEVFTYHLMWVAATTYSAKLAPEGLRATVIGVIGSLHYGIGRATGSMVGGTLMAVFDTRRAFRYIGIGSGVVAVFYFVCYYAYLRKYETTNVLIIKVVDVDNPDDNHIKTQDINSSASNQVESNDVSTINVAQILMDQVATTNQNNIAQITTIEMNQLKDEFI